MILYDTAPLKIDFYTKPHQNKPSSLYMILWLLSYRRGLSVQTGNCTSVTVLLFSFVFYQDLKPLFYPLPSAQEAKQKYTCWTQRRNNKALKVTKKSGRHQIKKTGERQSRKSSFTSKMSNLGQIVQPNYRGANMECRHDNHTLQ